MPFRLSLLALLLFSCASQKAIHAKPWDTEAAAPEETRITAVGMLDKLSFDFDVSTGHSNRSPAHLEVQPGAGPRNLVVIPLKKGNSEFVVFRNDGTIARRYHYQVLTNEHLSIYKNIAHLLEGIRGITVEPVDNAVAIRGKLVDPAEAVIVERVQRTYADMVLNLVVNSRDQCDQGQCAYRNSEPMMLDAMNSSMSGFASALPSEVAAEIDHHQQEVAKLAGKNETKVRELTKKTERKLASIQLEFERKGRSEEARAARDKIRELEGFMPMQQWFTPFESEIGRKYIYDVTGDLSGSVWGNGPFTADSSPGAAAVHAGLVKPGETATVEIDVIAGRPYYPGEFKNGVSAWQYGAWPVSYTIKRFKD